MLPGIDVKFLDERHPGYSVEIEADMTCVVIPAFSLPEGFAQTATDVLLRLSSLYPDAVPDMWWCDPPALRADGKEIAQTQHTETHVGRGWQRWSRHMTQEEWAAGPQNLRSYLAAVKAEFDNAVTD